MKLKSKRNEEGGYQTKGPRQRVEVVKKKKRVHITYIDATQRTAMDGGIMFVQYAYMDGR